ncbi:MAG: nuclear transport factor 2 family protein [Acidobacteriota bacterium]|nr:nuclear transport factor 2 family protein [Acidobacteriota bacterium]
MTEESILKIHRQVFLKSLLEQDWPSLADLYADDYTLVRSDGTTLGKEAVLADLTTGGLLFRSIELTHERVRLLGSVAVITGDSKTVAERGSLAFQSAFRFVAVYVESGEDTRLLHFQSTDIKPRT